MYKFLPTWEEMVLLWRVGSSASSVQTAKDVAMVLCQLALFYPNKGGQTMLHFAAKTQQESIFLYVFDRAEAINSPSDDQGMTPLHIAAQNGQVKLCQWIIEEINDKNPATDNGVTPLGIAAKSGHLEVCQLIIEKLQRF